MKELKTEFDGRGEMKGFKFRQLYATDKAYMYEVKSEKVIHYEVFQKIENARYDCISYPGSKSFGICAWCIRDYDEAVAKLKDITDHRCKGCGCQISYDVEYCGECICEDDMDI